MQFPNLGPILAPILTGLQGAVPYIAGIIFIWVIYEEWTKNPTQFSWFAVLWKGVGIGLIAYFLLNAQPILASISGGGTPPPTP